MNIKEYQKGNATVIIVLILVVVIGGYLLFGRGGGSEATPSPTASVVVSPSATSAPTSSASSSPAVQVKVFNVSGKPFSFDLTEIKVKKGDTVKIVFTNTEGTHDWVIDEFNARTPVIQANKTAEVQFVADKTGTFEYYCSVGQHRAMGMKGKLVVE